MLLTFFPCLRLCRRLRRRRHRRRHRRLIELVVWDLLLNMGYEMVHDMESFNKCVPYVYMFTRSGVSVLHICIQFKSVDIFAGILVCTYTLYLSSQRLRRGIFS